VSEAMAQHSANRGATGNVGGRIVQLDQESEQAVLAIVQGNALKDPTVQILEYKEMEPSSSRARATSLEQQQSCLRWIEAL
jgi:hypothetical protein